MQGIQDLLICLEMLVAAVFFFYAFPLSDYLKNPQDQSHPPQHPEQHHHAEDDSGGEGPLVGSNVSSSQCMHGFSIADYFVVSKKRREQGGRLG